jgi:hypothetical protein
VEAGRFEQATGRSGQGPGEFGEVSFLWRVGEDSILVADPVNFRLTTLDRDLQKLPGDLPHPRQPLLRGGGHEDSLPGEDPPPGEPP